MTRRRLTTTERGLGAPHQRDLERLRAALKDGDPCWRCGRPMYRSQIKTGPGYNPWAPERDHLIDRALGGADGPAVLSHAHCNRSAGSRARHTRTRTVTMPAARRW